MSSQSEILVDMLLAGKKYLYCKDEIKLTTYDNVTFVKIILKSSAIITVFTI